MQLLQILHILAALIHGISCSLSIWLHTDTIDGQVTLPHHTYMEDPTASLKQYIVNATVTHEKVLYTNPMVWIAGNEGITFFSHLLALGLMFLDPSKLDIFERRRRTIEYAFTAGILQVALVLGVGSIALYDVLWLLGVNIAIQLLGWLADDPRGKELRNWLLGIAFGLLSIEIFYVIMQSVNLNGIDSGPYVAMGVAYGVFYILFGVVKLIPAWERDQNEIYVLMSVTSKVALSWILIGNTFEGLKELGVKSEPFDHTWIDWRLIQIIISSTCGVILVGGIIAITMRKNENILSSDDSVNQGFNGRERRTNYKYTEITSF